MLKKIENQTIFKEFNIFLHKKLIYVLERPNVVKTIGIPVDIICSFFSGGISKLSILFSSKKDNGKRTKNRLRAHAF